MAKRPELKDPLIDEVADRMDRELRKALHDVLSVAYKAGVRDGKEALKSNGRAEMTDRARMDWLESNAAHFIYHKEKGNGIIRLRKGFEEPIDLRRAIDEAMKGGSDVYIGSDRGL